MNIIILQHIDCETPGYIKDLMLADGIDLTTINLHKGDIIPSNLNFYDAMFCMGGAYGYLDGKRLSLVD